MSVHDGMTRSHLSSSNDENVTSFHESIVETLDKSTNEPTTGIGEIIGSEHLDIPRELVSSRTITQGSRTIETITVRIFPIFF